MTTLAVGEVGCPARPSSATALHCAAQLCESSASVPILINVGVDVNQADNDGNCPAHWAARSGRIDNLKFLLEHDAQFNQRNNAGKTVFGVAAVASTDACETMRWLLDSGADIGAIDITAAHRAVSPAFGAAVSAANHNGETPFMVEIDRWNLDIDGDLVLSFAAAGHCCGVMGVTVELDSPTIGAIVVAGGGLVSAGVDTDELLAQEAHAIDLILLRQKRLFRMRAWQVCIGLQSLRVSALEMCEILAHMFAPLESLVPFHIMWKVVLAVKHFAKH
jgi:hypothetical protein